MCNGECLQKIAVEAHETICVLSAFAPDENLLSEYELIINGAITEIIIILFKIYLHRASDSIILKIPAEHVIQSSSILIYLLSASDLVILKIPAVHE